MYRISPEIVSVCCNACKCFQFSLKFSHQCKIMLFTLTTDSPLGRVSLAHLSNQSRMELLVEGFTETSKAKLRRSGGDFFDICDWKEVDCDASGEIQSISFFSYARGSIALDFIPPTVTSFTAEGKRFTGTLDTRLLPPELTKLNLKSNALEGTVDMGSLPAALRTIALKSNNFSGNVDLTALPVTLHTIDLSENGFFGSVALDKLPSGLKDLYLYENQFDGEVFLDALPDSLRFLNIELNHFYGTFSLLRPPWAAVAYRAGSNDFCGTAVIRNTFSDVHLHGAVRAVVDQDGDAHPFEAQILGTRAI